MRLEITTTAPTWDQFRQWGVAQAYPTIYVELTYYDNITTYLHIEVMVNGHYYCSGSCNFDFVRGSVTKLHVTAEVTDDEFIAMRDLATDTAIEQALMDTLLDSSGAAIEALVEDSILEYIALRDVSAMEIASA